MYLVVSSSVNPDSRSRRLALSAKRLLQAATEESVGMVDLSNYDLPLYDGSPSLHPDVAQVTDCVASSSAIVFVLPVYRNEVAVAARNLVQHCGKALQRKVVAIASVSGDSIAHHHTVGFANALMLEHRVFIIPDFVFVDSKQLKDTSADSIRRVEGQIEKMTDSLIRVTVKLMEA